MNINELMAKFKNLANCFPNILKESPYKGITEALELLNSGNLPEKVHAISRLTSLYHLAIQKELCIIEKKTTTAMDGLTFFEATTSVTWSPELHTSFSSFLCQARETLLESFEYLHHALLQESELAALGKKKNEALVQLIGSANKIESGNKFEQYTKILISSTQKTLLQDSRVEQPTINLLGPHETQKIYHATLHIQKIFQFMEEYNLQLETSSQPLPKP